MGRTRCQPRMPTVDPERFGCATAKPAGMWEVSSWASTGAPQGMKIPSRAICSEQPPGFERASSTRRPADLEGLGNVGRPRAISLQFANILPWKWALRTDCSDSDVDQLIGKGLDLRPFFRMSVHSNRQSGGFTVRRRSDTFHHVQ